MAPKEKKDPGQICTSRTHKKRLQGRDALGAYIAHPKNYPSSRVIYYNDSFVVINDMYPKSSVHTLLLPRSTAHAMQHPFDAFEDASFLATVRSEAEKLKGYVAKELQRRFGKHSAQDAVREAVLNGEKDAPLGEDGKPQLPPGRDWSKEVLVGIHAGPSMSHLHVHVASVDMFSDRLRHRKHYNSFKTPFLVDLADFPLAADDPRRHNIGAYLRQDLVCWRCGANFGDAMKALKDHLAEEFERWKRD